MNPSALRRTIGTLTVAAAAAVTWAPPAHSQTTTAPPPSEPATTAVPPATVPLDAGDAGPGWGVVVIVGLLALGAGAGGGFALSRRHPSQEALSPPVMPSVPAVNPFRSPSPSSPAGADADAHLTRDRTVLVDALIEMAEVVPSAALKQRMTQALRSAGVTTVDPVGQPFDAARHHGRGTEPAPQPAMHNVVASTDKPGWEDRGRQLRAPEVIVYEYTEGR